MRVKRTIHGTTTTQTGSVTDEDSETYSVTWDDGSQSIIAKSMVKIIDNEPTYGVGYPD